MAAAVAFIATTDVAHAQVPPTVRIAGTTAMEETQQCFTEPTFSPGSFTLERNQSEGAVDVTYHISGGPTDLNSDPTAGADHTVSFADGQTQVTVTVHPALGGGAATVTVVDGLAYDLGDPSSATIAKVVHATTCPAAEESTTTTTRPRELVRTGATSSTPELAVIGVAMVAIGLTVLAMARKRSRVSRLP
jgi:hypothetical protein